MTINLEIFYEDNVVPLERVSMEDMEPGNTYITLDGSRIELTEERDIVLLKNSPLREGEKVNTLGIKAQELLFRLLNKSLPVINKEEDD